MLRRLRSYFGDHSAACLCGVPVFTFRQWCSRGSIRPAAAVRCVWLVYALTLRPEIVTTLFDIATWGRYRWVKDPSAGWSDWSI